LVYESNHIRYRQMLGNLAALKTVNAGGCKRDDLACLWIAEQWTNGSI